LKGEKNRRTEIPRHSFPTFVINKSEGKLVTEAHDDGLVEGDFALLQGIIAQKKPFVNSFRKNFLFFEIF
jgi:hypothetical protein